MYELALEIKENVREVSAALEASQPIDSLQRIINSDRTRPRRLAETLACSNMEEDGLVENLALNEAIEKLSFLEKEIIFLRFFEEKTQKQVGEKIGKSQVQVSRLERKILKKLKEILEPDPLN